MTTVWLETLALLALTLGRAHIGLSNQYGQVLTSLLPSYVSLSSLANVVDLYHGPSSIRLNFHVGVLTGTFIHYRFESHLVGIY